MAKVNTNSTNPNTIVSNHGYFLTQSTNKDARSYGLANLFKI